MDKMLGRKRAIVVGAGAAGLYCAASLSSLYEFVVLVEKDLEIPGPLPRKGVAQGAHLHNILAAGLWLLEQTYTGVTEDLIAHGGAPMAIGINQHIYDSEQWLPSRNLGIDVVALSRPLLDHILYKKTIQYPNIEYLKGLKIESLHLENGAATGVNFLTKDGTPKRLDADLVVDASGVSAVLWKTLARDLSIKDELEEVESKIVYCSAIIKKPEQWRSVKENVLIIPEPSQNAGGALIDIEDNQWMVSLHGRHGIAPPTNPTEWKAFSQQLATDAIWERIRHAEVVSPVRMFNKPKSSLRRFDKIHAVPSGYFPIGDLISSVNPIFGQGMTVAWGHVHELIKALNSEQSATGVWQSYADRALAWSQAAWNRSSAYDRLFLKAELHTEKSALELDLVKKLAAAKIKGVIQSEDAHRQMVVQAHMLDRIQPAQSQEK
jgi:2-polyprenyl-6-methoxyphenol hydroxylase-like FAD-dependent oxidoreductase